eukprot:GHVP01062830.1.p1 GENE.GHVP01062830.1~~GHVP01062830.1.p1  ORF type:complete len:1360 (-),score=188.95 GHVP01062830.1:1986-6065(-)
MSVSSGLASERETSRALNSIKDSKRASFAADNSTSSTFVNAATKVNNSEILESFYKTGICRHKTESFENRNGDKITNSFVPQMGYKSKNNLRQKKIKYSVQNPSHFILPTNKQSAISSSTATDQLSKPTSPCPTSNLPTVKQIDDKWEIKISNKERLSQACTVASTPTKTPQTTINTNYESNSSRSRASSFPEFQKDEISSINNWAEAVEKCPHQFLYYSNDVCSPRTNKDYQRQRSLSLLRANIGQCPNNVRPHPGHDVNWCLICGPCRGKKCLLNLHSSKKELARSNVLTNQKVSLDTRNSIRFSIANSERLIPPLFRSRKDSSYLNRADEKKFWTIPNGLLLSQMHTNSSQSNEAESADSTNLDPETDTRAGKGKIHSNLYHALQNNMSLKSKSNQLQNNCHSSTCNICQQVNSSCRKKASNYKTDIREAVELVDKKELVESTFTDGNLNLARSSDTAFKQPVQRFTASPSDESSKQHQVRNYTSEHGQNPETPVPLISQSHSHISRSEAPALPQQIPAGLLLQPPICPIWPSQEGTQYYTTGPNPPVDAESGGLVPQQFEAVYSLRHGFFPSWTPCKNGPQNKNVAMLWPVQQKHVSPPGQAHGVSQGISPGPYQAVEGTQGSAFVYWPPAWQPSYGVLPNAHQYTIPKIIDYVAPQYGSNQPTKTTTEDHQGAGNKERPPGLESDEHAADADDQLQVPHFTPSINKSELNNNSNGSRMSSTGVRSSIGQFSSSECSSSTVSYAVGNLHEGHSPYSKKNKMSNLNATVNSQNPTDNLRPQHFNMQQGGNGCNFHKNHLRYPNHLSSSTCHHPARSGSNNTKRSPGGNYNKTSVPPESNFTENELRCASEFQTYRSAEKIKPGGSLFASVAEQIQQFVADVDTHIQQVDGPRRRKIIEFLETDIKKLLTTRMSQYLNISTRQPKVQAFGSCYTNLFLPWSDIDLSIGGLYFPASTLDTLTFDPRHEFLLDLCEVLDPCRREDDPRHHRMSANLIKHVGLIPANMPILQLTTDYILPEQHIQIDISVVDNSHKGLLAARLVKKLTEMYSTLRPLTLVMKNLLHCRTLNKPYEGGLSSYALVLMIIAFLQNPGLYNFKERCPGEQLVNLLAFYAGIPVPSGGSLTLPSGEPNSDLPTNVSSYDYTSLAIDVDLSALQDSRGNLCLDNNEMDTLPLPMESSRNHSTHQPETRASGGQKYPQRSRLTTDWPTTAESRELRNSGCHIQITNQAGDSNLSAKSEELPRVSFLNEVSEHEIHDDRHWSSPPSSDAVQLHRSFICQQKNSSPTPPEPRLSIRDPLNRSNNVGKSTRNLTAIQNAFAQAYYVLLSPCVCCPSICGSSGFGARSGPCCNSLKRVFF